MLERRRRGGRGCRAIGNQAKDLSKLCFREGEPGGRIIPRRGSG
jgi:hypothetical protein